MISILANSIPYLFYLLVFLVPLTVYPYTSELFEFNKIIVLYTLTAAIAAAWIIRCIQHRKVIFTRTYLDIPIAIFLVSQILSTLASVDIRTSFFGYYSRYHGGLLSYLSYSLLYWAYVSNMDRKNTFKTIYIAISSGIIVSVYGVLQHFGIDAHIWVQDVQNRVFSTLGQPNWLAAFIVALLPVTWSLAAGRNPESQSAPAPERLFVNYYFYLATSSLFFLTLIYTKSRSGFVGFITLLAFFAGYLIYQYSVKRIGREYLLKFTAIIFAFVILMLISGTPWTRSVFSKQTDRKSTVQIISGDLHPFISPQLEIDPFSSTDIRKIVWTGSVDIWKNYPILGSGVETFAYSYYNFRPVEHNLVSEWDFLYNKAHNEYLNFAATTGAVGIASYLLLICAILYSIFRLSLKRDISEKNHDKDGLLHAGFFAGFIGIVVTNFFGFSVVPVALLFFLLPAFSYTLSTADKESKNNVKSSAAQNAAALVVIMILVMVFRQIAGYWYADYLYARGKAHNDVANYSRAHEHLLQAIELSPNESVFWEELAQSSMGIAVSLFESENELYREFLTGAARESQRAVDLSPRNVNSLRKKANILINLSPLEPSFLPLATRALEKAVDLAPTEAKLHYNLALGQLRGGDANASLETLEKTIEMKPDYANARIAYALVLYDLGNRDLAIQELEFVLEHIDPNNTLAKQQLEEIR